MKTQILQAIHFPAPTGIPLPDGGVEIPNRVFLGGIPSETTEQELQIFFSEYGAISDVRIVTDRKTGACKGYGFVTFKEDEDIARLLAKKSIVIKGKRLRVRKAVRRNGSQFEDSDDEGEVQFFPALGTGSTALPSSPQGRAPIPSPGLETYYSTKMIVNNQSPNFGSPCPPPSFMASCAPQRGIPAEFTVEGQRLAFNTLPPDQSVVEWATAPMEPLCYMPVELAQAAPGTCALPQYMPQFDQSVHLFQPKLCYIPPTFPVPYGLIGN